MSTKSKIKFYFHGEVLNEYSFKLKNRIKISKKLLIVFLNHFFVIIDDDLYDLIWFPLSFKFFFSSSWSNGAKKSYTNTTFKLEQKWLFLCIANSIFFWTIFFSLKQTIQMTILGPYNNFKIYLALVVSKAQMLSQ